MRSICLMFVLLAASILPAGAQVFPYFQDSPTTNYYDYSWMELTLPSYLERMGTDLRRFPVETAVPAQQGMNSLRLHWQSKTGGDWVAIAAGLNWTEHDLTGTDTLSFYFYSVEGIAKENLPTVFMEDIYNVKTTKHPITPYAGDLPAGVWVRIAIPMSLFFDAGDPVDFTVIKTVGYGQNLADTLEHTLFIDDVRVFAGNGIFPPAPVPQGLTAEGYDSHVFLQWIPDPDSNLSGYEIYQSADGGLTFQLRGIAGKDDSSYSDFVRDEGTNLSLEYTITALNSANQPSGFSDTVAASTYDMTDDELLTMVQEATFRYFWDFAHPVSGLARERNTSGDIVAIGGSGFGVMAILVGIERGFITRQQGVERMLKILNFLENADRFHGAFPHWMDGNTGHVIPFSTYDNGGDLVETSYMMQGLLTARQYFNQNTPDEQAIVNKITDLWESVDWNWYRRNNSNVLYWHWSPNYQWTMNMPIRGYNEAMIVYLLAVASPTHGVPASLFHTGWAGASYMNGKTFYYIKIDVGPDWSGPLFFEHYSFLGFDPRNKKDSYTNYFRNSRNLTLIDRAYCIDNPKSFEGYGEDCWGLTASDDPDGYKAHEPMYVDNGTITPSAALSSMPYTPEYSLQVLKHLYRDLGKKVWGPMGFYDAFNIHVDWYATSYIAIDQGPIIGMIENYRSQLLWNNFMSNPEIQPMLDSIGFVHDPFGMKEIEGKNKEEMTCFVDAYCNKLVIDIRIQGKKAFKVNIFDTMGHNIGTILDAFSPGFFEKRLTVNTGGFPSGIYLLVLQSDDHVMTKKFVLVRK